MLKAGTMAPDFTLQDQDGKNVSLSDFKGKKVVLYFYSKDNTAGCNKQACAYAEQYPAFTKQGAVVIGISKDTSASHRKFADKFRLPFILLADPEAGRNDRPAQRRDFIYFPGGIPTMEVKTLEKWA